MCGIFGFIASGDKGPNMLALRSIAWHQASRGEDAFGLAWIDPETGNLETYKRAGSIRRRLDVLELVRGSSMVVGHCRFATSGDRDDPNEAHPFRAGSGVYVHNGKILNAPDLIERHGLEVETGCDSEVIGRLYERSRSQGVLERLVRAVNLCSPNALALVGLWAGASPKMVMMRREGRPLWAGNDKRGNYLGSLPTYLPGRHIEFKANLAYSFGPKGVRNAVREGKSGPPEPAGYLPFYGR
jgi:glucosamine 6-phosphate synthetase-like amidotransferase/phosphosugar isomerase protein